MGNNTVLTGGHSGHVEMVGLNEDQLREMEHRKKLIEMHKGHETMHTEMIMIYVVLLFVTQLILVEWKRRHYRSYQMITLAGMWIIPPVLCYRSSFWRFIIIWVAFSIITALIIRKATKKPVRGNTPRLVYKWFYFIYKGSYALGLIAYTLMMLTFCGVNLLFDSKTNVWMDTAMTILFYGLYYGVMGQDFAEICTDKMATHIGYYTAQGMPTRYLEIDVCAVCGNKFLVGTNQEGVIENTYQLSCGHTFHEFCIRGWCIIGKKQICPYCKEKVDLKRMFHNPWEKPHVLFGQLLDWLRWLVAWQPIILFLFQAVNYILGLE